LESKNCYVCGKCIDTKDEIGLNKKLFGLKIVKFWCYDCLAEQLEVDVEDLLAKVEEFKADGCVLFE